MAGTGLAESIRQIAQFPTKTAANPADLLLLQNGGLGGPYQTIAAANLVATALESSTAEMVITGPLSVGGDFGVGGHTSIQGELDVLTKGSFGSDLFTGNNLSVAGSATIVQNMTVQASASVDGNFDVGGGMTVQLQTDFFAGVGIAGSLEVLGGVSVGCGLAVSGGVTAQGPFHSTGDASFTGNMLLGGGAQFGGGAKFGGGISTAGSITVDGGVGMRECLSVGKDAIIGGTATVGSLNVNGNSCFAGSLGITGNLDVGNGNLTLGGNFTAMGITTLQAGAMDVTGDLCVQGNLGVMGLLSAGSGFFKDGLATADGAQIAGWLSVGQGATICGPTFMHGDLTVNGRVGISGALHLNGEAVATEMWTRGYVCHVGSDLLDAITTATHELRDEIRAELNDENSDMMEFIRRTFAPINSPHFTGIPLAPNPSPFANNQQIATTQWVKGLIVEGVAGVASFNGRGGHVELSSDDIEHADGILRPASHPTNYYAWHDGRWTMFELGVPEPTGVGLWGRYRSSGGTAWEAVAPRPPNHPTNWFAWHNNAWATFDPAAGAGGGGGIDDVPPGITSPQARVNGAWQATVPQPPSTADTYFALRNSIWTAFEPGSGGGGNGGGGLTQQDLENALANYLPLSGGSLTGPLTLPLDGSGAQAVRYSQMATAISGLVTTTAMTTAIGAAIGTATADMATQSWASGQISNATSGMATQGWVSGQITGMATQSWVGQQITDMATQTWTGGQISSATAGLATQSYVSNAVGTATAGMATQTWVTGQIAAIPAAPNTLQLSFIIPGKPAAGQIYNVAVSVPMNLAANFPGSVGVVGTNPSAARSFAVNRNGSALGTVSLATNGAVSFSGGAAQLAAGDVLQIVAPATQDATLADIGISLLTTRAESPVAFAGPPGRDGAQIITVADEQTAISQSASDPANFYVWT